MDTASPPSAGWYPDPGFLVPLRWWDGRQWTDAVDARAGWYPDPWRQAPYRWFDGGQWTPSTHVPAPAPAAPVHSPAEAATAPVSAPSGTGLGRTDRIVEIAVVTMDATGQVVSTFETLVTPPCGTSARPGFTG